MTKRRVYLMKASPQEPAGRTSQTSGYAQIAQPRNRILRWFKYPLDGHEIRSRPSTTRRSDSPRGGAPDRGRPFLSHRIDKHPLPARDQNFRCTTSCRIPRSSIGSTIIFFGALSPAPACMGGFLYDSRRLAPLFFQLKRATQSMSALRQTAAASAPFAS